MIRNHFVLILLLLSIHHVCANNIYTIKTEISETAKTAAIAKDKAILDGQLNAFKLLLDRLIENPKIIKIEQLPQEEIISLLESFQLINEKNSSVLYKAELICKFNKQRVEDFLTEKSISFIEHAPKPIVVIPIIIQKYSTLLWEDSNAWKQAWESQKVISKITPILIPIGDLQDISSITLQEAIDLDIDCLNKLASRYKTKRVALVILSELNNEINLHLKKENDKIKHLVVNLSDSSPKYEDYIKKVTSILEAKERKETLKQIKCSQQSMFVSIPIERLKTWKEIQKVLKEISSIKDFDLLSFSKKKASLNINYTGSINYLQQSLRELGYELYIKENSWELIKIKNYYEKHPQYN